jgi:hypothetical protein
MAESWQAPDADPIKDLLATLNCEEHEFRPVSILCTKKEIITLKATDLYENWKDQWQKDHRILAVLERISNWLRRKK